VKAGIIANDRRKTLVKVFFLSGGRRTSTGFGHLNFFNFNGTRTLLPSSTSLVTFLPVPTRSFRPLEWTNISLPPLSGVIKPEPLTSCIDAFAPADKRMLADLSL